MQRVSLNIDLGELPDESEEFYSLATMVNIACGGHAGNEETMARAVELAKQSGASIAAHPSYPDREHFGRISRPMTILRLARSIKQQIDTLLYIAKHRGANIIAVKPHGALYHDAALSGYVAEILITTVEYLMEVTPGLHCAVVGPPNGVSRKITEERQIRYLKEGFADRNYSPDGSLVPRTEKNALILDPKEAAAQAIRLAQSGSFDTLCVHGDTPNALEIARAVRRALIDAQLLEGG